MGCAGSQYEEPEPEDEDVAAVEEKIEEATQYYEEKIEPLEVMDKLLPKLEARIPLPLKEPEAWEATIQEGAKKGYATLAARRKDDKVK